MADIAGAHAWTSCDPPMATARGAGATAPNPTFLNGQSWGYGGSPPELRAEFGRAGDQAAGWSAASRNAAKPARSNEMS